jgi:hypothetical protein
MTNSDGIPFEVTYCPAPFCLNKVRVWPGDQINFCCLNCWRWTWENGQLRTRPFGEDGEEIPCHSGQCADRQNLRDNWFVAEDRPFTIMGRSQD